MTSQRVFVPNSLLACTVDRRVFWRPARLGGSSFEMSAQAAVIPARNDDSARYASMQYAIQRDFVHGDSLVSSFKVVDRLRLAMSADPHFVSNIRNTMLLLCTVLCHSVLRPNTNFTLKSPTQPQLKHRFSCRTRCQISHIV
jgi:hypothetical protein